MALNEESEEEKRLNEQFRRTNLRFRELSNRAKELADRSLANTISATRLQAQTSAASEALSGISNVAGPLRDAVQSAAKNSLFLGSTLETATNAVKVASKEYDKKTQDVRRLRRALGAEANTISGINQLENARKAAVQARVELFQKEIEQIDAALTSQAQVIQRRQEELDASERSLAITQASISSEEGLITAKTTLIESIQASIIAQQQKIDADKEARDVENQVKKLNEDQLASLQRQKSVQEGLIQTKQAEIAAVDAVIAQERAREVQLQSELSQNAAKKAAIQAEIGAAVNYQQRSALESLHRQALEDLAREESDLTQRLTDTQDSITREVSARVDLADELRSQQTALADTTSEINRTQSDLAANAAEIKRLTDEINAGGENMAILRAQLEAEEEVRRKGMSKLADLQREEAKLIQTVQDNKDALDSATSTLQELTELRQDKIQDEAAEKQNDLNDSVEAKQKQLQLVSGILNKVATALNNLVAPILQLQKQFGISAGSAAKLKFENLMASANSYMNSLMTGGPAVSTKEIEDTQSAFQGEFGGVLTSDAATELAKEAKRMGVGAGEMAKARRVFMTSTMGDVGQAKAAQDKFIGEFAKKGLTSKDAMEAIGQNSNLLARNGTRFAASFARAAAEAKKIGVDLGKIDQVGDNIIGNFEGFLESQAELGAMGFGFDTNKLAEIAESGDTGALMGELQSQLASTGKDITKLRRSEQLALSEAFGLSMEDLQRMGAPGGSGEETLSPEELQKNANKSLSDLVFRADAIIKILGGIATLVAVINSRSLVKSFMQPGGVGASAANVAGKASSVMGRIATPLAGLVGGVSGFMTAKKSGKDNYESAGAGAVQGGLAAGGAVLGGMILPFLGPIGPMIGGYLGNTIGKAINKFFPSIGANIGLVFKGLVSSFQPVIKMFSGMWENLKKLGEPLFKIMGLFGGTTDKANNLWPVLEKVGYFIGSALLVPFNLIMTPISLIIGAFTTLAQLLTGDFSGALQTIKDTLSNSFAWIVEPVMAAVDAVKSVFTSIINWVIEKINILPGVNIPLIGEAKKGDDVVSRAGYGERTLVTPSGPIALNNNDNVIAYADDMISGAIGEGVRMLSYGALAQKESSTPTVNIDLSRLEQKLDAVVRAIGSMEVKMDGNKVGKVLVNSSDAARTVGVFRQDARATL